MLIEEMEGSCRELYVAVSMNETRGMAITRLFVQHALSIHFML